jgi:hypothetical protein
MGKILLDRSMRPRLFHAGIVKALLVTIIAVQLIACGGGGGSTASNAGSNSVLPSEFTSPDSTNTSTNNVTSTNGTGTLTLSWTAPVTRSDGTPLSLTDIDGFYIHYGNSPGNYTYHINVTDGTAQEAILKDLAAGTYYIVMTTYDVDGRESGYSAMVKKTAS